MNYSFITQFLLAGCLKSFVFFALKSYALVIFSLDKFLAVKSLKSKECTHQILLAGGWYDTVCWRLRLEADCWGSNPVSDAKWESELEFQFPLLCNSGNNMPHIMIRRLKGGKKSNVLSKVYNQSKSSMHVKVLFTFCQMVKKNCTNLDTFANFWHFEPLAHLKGEN